MEAASYPFLGSCLWSPLACCRKVSQLILTCPCLFALNIVVAWGPKCTGCLDLSRNISISSIPVQEQPPRTCVGHVLIIILVVLGILRPSGCLPWIFIGLSIWFLLRDVCLPWRRVRIFLRRVCLLLGVRGIGVWLVVLPIIGNVLNPISVDVVGGLQRDIRDSLGDLVDPLATILLMLAAGRRGPIASGPLLGASTAHGDGSSRGVGRLCGQQGDIREGNEKGAWLRPSDCILRKRSKSTPWKGSGNPEVYCPVTSSRPNM